MSESKNGKGFRTHKNYKKWLKFTSFVVGAFAPVFFLASLGVAEPTRFTLDLISWPIDGNPEFLHPSTLILSAISGGFLLGWGVMIWCLTIWVYDKEPELIRRIVLISLISWFVLDSAGSIASGNPFNALFNSVLLFAAVGPMWLPIKN